jgi:hypothetical protein
MIEEQKIYLWSELKLSGTQFPFIPTPEMLINDGVVETRNIKQYGEETFATYHVRYNRDYVVKYLAEKVFKSLGAIDYNELINLIKDSLKLRDDLIAEKMREFGTYHEKNTQ